MSITQHYQATIEAQGYLEDADQARAIQHFQRLYDELVSPPTSPGLLDRLLKKSTPPPLGLYLCSPPGRGKTYLMDLFYHHLPTQQKQRLHFHHFMQNIHAELASIKSQSEPLALIAKQVAEKTRVLCLDEFYVADIGDAMLLAGLLEALFANRVVLVTTSNSPPDNLYRNGLQRDRFLPAIALIKAHTQLITLNSGHDFRQQTNSINATQHYQLCDAESASALMAQRFLQLSGLPHRPDAGVLHINGRDIPYIAKHEGLIWFNFAALCESHRATSDYLEIAAHYSHVMVTHLPQFDEGLDNAAIRFIHLVDALYDRRVLLTTTAAAPPQALYRGIHHTSSFKRTASRLCEMERNYKSAG